MMRSVLSVCVMFTLLLQGLNAQSKVRLVNGTAPWNGRLEMLCDGTWLTVCGRRFKKHEAQVVCRELGFNTSQVYTGLLYMRRVTYNYIMFDDLRCTGEETSLEKCTYTGIISDTWCGNVIAITCNSQNIQVRLNFIQPNTREVQIHIGVGDWWTVCLSSDVTAMVVCRQLGLPWLGARTFVYKSLRHVNGVTDFSSCLGNETSIAECQPEMFSDGYCWVYTIICSDYIVNIHTTSSRYPLMAKTKATLKCESTEQSDVIKYTWPENAGGFPDGSSLIITRVTREHHGSRVRCEVMYSNGEVVSSDTLQLQVYYRPVIRIIRIDNQGQPLSTFSEVIKGHNVTFVCDADSNPPPASITWSGKVNSTTGELHIIAAQQTTHDGNYTCTVVTETADNDDRLPLRASYQLAFIVKAPVNVHTNSSRYPLMEETKATLKCESNERSDVIKYTWPENAGGFPDSSSLIITRVTREHHGRRVRCEVMYSDGEAVSSDTLRLQVYYRPVIRITRSDNQGQPLSTFPEVIKGHNVTFVCDADSNPPPASITWSGKVRSTTGELHIIAAQQKTHEGIYTCTVVTQTVDDDERLPLSTTHQLGFIIKDQPWKHHASVWPSFVPVLAEWFF